MIDPKYIRKGKEIRQVDVEPPVVTVYKSINAAKRESHRLQKANGGLGKGFVRVEAR